MNPFTNPVAAQIVLDEMNRRRRARRIGYAIGLAGYGLVWFAVGGIAALGVALLLWASGIVRTNDSIT